MIALHRITQPDQAVYLNPDLIQLIESTPDTVVTLTNGSKVIVSESAGDVTQLVRDWRASILVRALEAPVAAAHPHLASVLRFPAERHHPHGHH